VAAHDRNVVTANADGDVAFGPIWSMIRSAIC
jgi:hypothetical protein